MPKIKIQFFDEDSKYEGDPLLKPKIPYEYKYIYRGVDPSL